MNFRFEGLPAKLFRHLFALPESEFAVQWATHWIARDRDRGDGELILANHAPPPEDLPYRMRFASYLRSGGAETDDKAGEIPEQLRMRTLAVSAFDAGAKLVGWEMTEGRDLETAIARRFADPCAKYLHVHFAAPCFHAARVERS